MNFLPRSLSRKFNPAGRDLTRDSANTHLLTACAEHRRAQCGHVPPPLSTSSKLKSPVASSTLSTVAISDLAERTISISSG